MKLLFLLLFSLFGFIAPATARDMSSFQTIPVLEGGRIKPVDSFARAMLTRFSGKDGLKDISASEWLAECLFDPGSAVQRPVFRIDSALTRHQMGLPERKNPLYSYLEMTPGLKKTTRLIEPLYKTDPRALTADNKALLDIHDHAYAFTQILRSFSLILPLQIDLPKKFKAPKTLTYLDLKKYERDIQADTRRIVSRKGEDLSAYTEEEKKTALLSYQLAILGDAAIRNQLFRVIPVAWTGEEGQWQSPWSVLNQGQGSPDTARVLKLWTEMAGAWQTQNANEWNRTTSEAAQLPLDLSGQPGLHRRLALEVVYNQLAPFDLALLAYAFAFLAALAYLVGQQPVFLKGGLALLAIGAVIHFGGIATRVILLERPPVSTLYESLIFVGWVCALIGLLLERGMKSGSGLLTGSVSALFILMLADSFGSDGDTLLMLSAVLNTRFWLATHVLCITFGYGWCVATSAMAHIVLAAKAFRLQAEEKISSLLGTVMTLAMVALLFTATGTILGGIWADQSWGRFWGWDPKENGALLIVLWLVWIMHGKLSGHLKTDALLAASAFLSVIVGAAWIGVNLLGVGLHSYGFTDGVFMGLGIFAAVEMLVIGGLWYLSRRPHEA